jgi:hypothetical protein
VQATRVEGRRRWRRAGRRTRWRGAGQVVIGVFVADVLFVDTQIRRGWHREYF